MTEVPSQRTIVVSIPFIFTFTGEVKEGIQSPPDGGHVVPTFFLSLLLVIRNISFMNGLSRRTFTTSAFSEVNVRILLALAPRKSTVSIMSKFGASAGGMVEIEAGAGVGAAGPPPVGPVGGPGEGEGAGPGSRLELIAKNRNQKLLSSFSNSLVNALDTEDSSAAFEITFFRFRNFDAFFFEVTKSTMYGSNTRSSKDKVLGRIIALVVLVSLGGVSLLFCSHWRDVARVSWSLFHTFLFLRSSCTKSLLSFLLLACGCGFSAKEFKL